MLEIQKKVLFVMLDDEYIRELNPFNSEANSTRPK